MLQKCEDYYLSPPVDDECGICENCESEHWNESLCDDCQTDEFNRVAAIAEFSGAATVGGIDGINEDREYQIVEFGAYECILRAIGEDSTSVVDTHRLYF